MSVRVNAASPLFVFSESVYGRFNRKLSIFIGSVHLSSHPLLKSSNIPLFLLPRHLFPSTFPSLILAAERFLSIIQMFLSSLYFSPVFFPLLLSSILHRFSRYQSKYLSHLNQNPSADSNAFTFSITRRYPTYDSLRTISIPCHGNLQILK